MSTHTLPWAPAGGPQTVYAAATAAIRAPVSVAENGTTITFVYTPDLSAAEVTTLTGIVADAVAASRTVLSLAEYQALKASLATLRQFQQMSQAEFIALAQNARDRTLFDVSTAQIRVMRALLRD